MSLGAIVMGTFLNVCLYGIMLVQTSNYFSTHKQDQLWVKLMVGWLLILDTLNTVFDVGFVYRYTITLFGDFSALAHSHWFFHLSPLITVAIASTVQGFYAWRINRLTGWLWVSVGIGLVVLVQFVAGFVTTIGAFRVVDFARFDELRVEIVLWLITSAVTDVVVTSILTWYLHTHRTGFPRTNDLVTKLIRITVQTGMITTIWAVVDLIVFLTVPTPLHLLFNLPLCKLYTNTLLSTLNARSGWDKSQNGTSTARSTNGMSVPTSWARDKASSQVQEQSEIPPQTIGVSRGSNPRAAVIDSFELDDYSKSQPIDIERGDGKTRSSHPVTGTVQLKLPVKPHAPGDEADEWSMHSPSLADVSK